MAEKNIRTNVQFPESLWERAKTRAVKDRVSLAEIIRRALKEYLKPEKLIPLPRGRRGYRDVE